MEMPLVDFSSVLENFLNKANSTTINIIVWIIGILMIIAIGIMLFIFIRKLYKTFLKEEKYVGLLENYNNLEKKYEETYKNYDKTSAIIDCLNQLSISINILINDFIYAQKLNEEIKVIAEELIKTIVYVIPQNFKINIGDYHRCFIWMKKYGNENVLENVYSSTGKILEDLHIQNSFAGRIFTTGDYRYSANIELERDFERRHSTSKYKSLIGVPIEIGEETLGVLTIDAKKEDAFNETDIISLSLFATQISSCFLLLSKIYCIISAEGDSNDVI
jgi:transcriptional regulator with GAF, ATPase, and Fis domain